MSESIRLSFDDETPPSAKRLSITLRSGSARVSSLRLENGKLELVLSAEVEEGELLAGLLGGAAATAQPDAPRADVATAAAPLSPLADFSAASSATLSPVPSSAPEAATPSCSSSASSSAENASEPEMPAARQGSGSIAASAKADVAAEVEEEEAAEDEPLLQDEEFSAFSRSARKPENASDTALLQLDESDRMDALQSFADEEEEPQSVARVKEPSVSPAPVCDTTPELAEPEEGSKPVPEVMREVVLPDTGILLSEEESAILEEDDGLVLEEPTIEEPALEEEGPEARVELETPEFSAQEETGSARYGEPQPDMDWAAFRDPEPSSEPEDEPEIKPVVIPVTGASLTEDPFAAKGGASSVSPSDLAIEEESGAGETEPAVSGQDEVASDEPVVEEPSVEEPAASASPKPISFLKAPEPAKAAPTPKPRPAMLDSSNEKTVKLSAPAAGKKEGDGFSLLEDDFPPSDEAVSTAPKAMIKFACPRCGTPGTQYADKVGSVVTCQSCGKAMRLTLRT